jgi:hypothetical protein
VTVEILQSYGSSGHDLHPVMHLVSLKICRDHILEYCDAIHDYMDIIFTVNFSEKYYYFLLKIVYDYNHKLQFLQ